MVTSRSKDFFFFAENEHTCMSENEKQKVVRGEGDGEKWNQDCYKIHCVQKKKEKKKKKKKKNNEKAPAQHDQGVYRRRDTGDKALRNVGVLFFLLKKLFFFYFIFLFLIH